MTREEARSLVLQALKKPGWDQFENLLVIVGDLKAERFNLKRDNRQFISMDGRQFLEGGERALVNELIWAFIIEGILSPGTDDSNINLPFLRVTAYGEACLREDQLIPHDPEGYLTTYRQMCPSADSVIVDYLTEALQCYLRSLHRAAAIMLGAASEQAVLLLLRAWLESIGDDARKANLIAQVEKSSSIYRRFELFQKHLLNFRARLPRELAENIDSLLVSVFDLIRNSRNDAGHPARMSDVARDTNYAHLRLFVPYCQRIYSLIEWLHSNPT